MRELLCTCACASSCAPVHARACAHARACGRVRVCACVRARARAWCVSVRVRGPVCVRVYAHAPARVRLLVRACPASSPRAVITTRGLVATPTIVRRTTAPPLPDAASCTRSTHASMPADYGGQDGGKATSS
eukprot:590488-Pleurochrysis_carterae.AAC.2